MVFNRDAKQNESITVDVIKEKIFKLALSITIFSVFVNQLKLFKSAILSTPAACWILLVVLLILFLLPGKMITVNSYIFIILTEIFMVITFSNSEMHVSGFFWLPFIPVVSVLLLGFLPGLINTIVIFGSSFYIFISIHLPKFDTFPSEAVFQLSMFAITMTVFVVYFVYILEKKQKRLQKEIANRTELETVLRDYERVVENTDVVISVVDKSYSYIIVNRAFEHQSAMDRSEILGNSIEHLFGSELFLTIKPYIDSSFTGESTEYQLDVQDPEKGQRTMLLKYYPIFEQDKVDRVVLMARDITDFKLLQNERQRLFELSIDGLCIAGFDGQFKDLNPAWERILGWKREELLAKPWLEFVHPDDHERSVQAGQRLIKGEAVFNFENRYQCKDGSYRWVSWNSFPEFKWEQIFAVVRDVTDQKNFENEREELIVKLQHAFDEVKTLQGIIPICSHCNKIRDEEGAWNQLEAYISKHSNALFSHGICPDCVKKHYPKYGKKQ